LQVWPQVLLQQQVALQHRQQHLPPGGAPCVLRLPPQQASGATATAAAVVLSRLRWMQMQPWHAS
jgi:hypothetical protein